MERTKYVAKTGHTVFLLEDDPTLQKLYKKGLDRYGHDVYVFGNAEDFVGFMSTANLKPTDAEGRLRKYVLVADYNLPGKNGSEAMAEVGRLPLVIDLHKIGTSANPDNLRRFKEKGADLVIDKAQLNMTSLDQVVRAA